MQDVYDLRLRLIDMWAMPLISGADVSVPAFEPEEDILNMHCGVLIKTLLL